MSWSRERHVPVPLSLPRPHRPIPPLNFSFHLTPTSVSKESGAPIGGCSKRIPLSHAPIPLCSLVTCFVTCFFVLFICAAGHPFAHATPAKGAEKRAGSNKDTSIVAETATPAALKTPMPRTAQRYAVKGGTCGIVCARGEEGVRRRGES